jgi:hypothetical protein
MMKRIDSAAVPLVLALFSCLSGPMTLVAASLEEKYFETRDNFIRQFSTASSTQDKADKKALSQLEKRLQRIIGPVDVAHFPKRGKINLETLQQDAGFGQVDGLRFGSEFKLLFVTTTGLLNAYLQQHKEKLPTELGKLAKTEEFYSLVFDWDAAVTHFAEVPVRTTNDKSFAYAFLGLWGQDIGPFPPKHLFVFFRKWRSCICSVDRGAK